MKSVPWTKQFRRALAAPGNLIAGSGALALAAITWNPLPVILFGLGEPVWLYNATASDRYADAVRAEHDQRTIAVLERELAAFVEQTPCGSWMRGKQLPSYPVTYRRLVEMRDQTAQIVAARDDAAKQLEEDIVARMNDMLRAYLLMVRERLLFHCALAKVYPQLERPGRPTLLGRIKRALLVAPHRRPTLWIEDTRFVSLDVALHEVRAKATNFLTEIRRRPEHEDVYRPIIETLEKRVEELQQRGKNDLDLAAQLAVFPDQFEIILGKLGSSQANVGDIVSDMKLLLEQTDDTVRFAEDMRAGDGYTLARLAVLEEAA